MKYDTKYTLIVLDFLEYGGATRILQGMTYQRKKPYIVLAGYSGDAEEIKREGKISFLVSFPINFSRRSTLFISILLGVFWKSFALYRSYSVGEVILNLPFSSMPVLLNPFYWFIPKTYIFHGPWDIEQYASTSRNMPSIHRPLYTQVPGIRSKIVYFVHYWVQKYCLIRSNRIVVFSEYSRSIVEKYYSIPKQKIFKNIPPLQLPMYAISGTKRNEIRRRYNVPEDVTLFLVPSRLEPRKGIHILIESVDLLRKRSNKPFLVLCTGPIGIRDDYIMELFRACRERNLFGLIRFIGSVPREQELLGLYRGSDAVLLPSIGFETLGLVTLESLTLGVPVLAFQSGATPEILRHADSRLLASSPNAHSFAERMNWFLNLSLSERKILQKHARNGVEKWQEDMHSKQTI